MSYFKKYSFWLLLMSIAFFVYTMKSNKLSSERINLSFPHNIDSLFYQKVLQNSEHYSFDDYYYFILIRNLTYTSSDTCFGYTYASLMQLNKFNTINVYYDDVLNSSYYMDFKDLKVKVVSNTLQKYKIIEDGQSQSVSSGRGYFILFNDDEIFCEGYKWCDFATF